MDLLKLSFKENPAESKKIVKEIFKSDYRISILVKKLLK